jgi:hypothetical protein
MEAKFQEEKLRLQHRHDTTVQKVLYDSNPFASLFIIMIAFVPQELVVNVVHVMIRIRISHNVWYPSDNLFQ